MLAQRLKELRVRNHMNTATAGELANASGNSWWAWETERLVPNGYHLIEIAKAFEVSLDWLAGLTDEPDKSIDFTVENEEFLRIQEEKAEERCATVTGRRLAELRRKLEFPMKTMAELCGITYPMWSHWEKGESVPGGLSLLKIAKTYNVSADWLLGLSDKKSISK